MFIFTMLLFFFCIFKSKNERFNRELKWFRNFRTEKGCDTEKSRKEGGHPENTDFQLKNP